MGLSVLFYDGNCGLCDRTVQFLLKRGSPGCLRFAPIGGERYRRELLPRLQGEPLDAIAVLTDDGRVFWRSDATIYLLRQLGGPWRLVASGLQFIPKPLRDWGYRQVAAVRQKLFAAPSCPVALREPSKDRFDP